MTASDIEIIAQSIIKSKKYANITLDAVYREVASAAARYKKPKEIEKAAREKLHTVTGAFAENETLAAIGKYLSSGEMDKAYAVHASTRERMPLSDFYARLFDIIGRPQSVLDVGCGLNALYLAHMGIKVLGIDMNKGLMDVLKTHAEENGLNADFRSADLLTSELPEGTFDAALFMKLLPVIEQQKKGASRDLLLSANAENCVVTFPTRSLSGRNVGMEQYYSSWFEPMLSDFEILRKYTFNNELIYIIKRT